MIRRRFLTLVGCGTSVAITGCADVRGGTDAATVTDHSFETLAAADTPDEPTVTHSAIASTMGEVTIEGTITVRNGCIQLAVGSTPKFTTTEADVVSVMIGTRQEGEICTQALRDIGYRLTFTYENASPTEVEVAQAGVDSQVQRLLIPDATAE